MAQLVCNAHGSPSKRTGDDMMATLAGAKKFRRQLIPATPVSTGLHLARHGEDCSAGIYGESRIDALIHFHSEKIRSEVEDISKRHCGEIVSAIFRRMKEKDAELDVAMKKNAELETKLKETMAASQTWFHVAKNGEAAACGLKASVDRVLRSVRRNAADDAGSCCFEGEARRTGWCKPCRVCRNRDVSVLLLPCRHVCLCKECERTADACPICCAKKSGGVNVFIE